MALGGVGYDEGRERTCSNALALNLGPLHNDDVAEVMDPNEAPRSHTMNISSTPADMMPVVTGCSVPSALLEGGAGLGLHHRVELALGFLINPRLPVLPSHQVVHEIFYIETTFHGL